MKNLDEIANDKPITEELAYDLIIEKDNKLYPVEIKKK